MNNPSRRTFIVTAAAAACACAGCPLLASGSPARAVGPVDAGPLEDFGKDGVTERWAGSDGFFVVRRGGKLYAVSSHCTHKKVRLVVAKGDEGFKCPRHGSAFGADGHVIRSPARLALPRFAIRVKDNGHIVVDTAAQFGERDWGDPASFVDLYARR